MTVPLIIYIAFMATRNPIPLNIIITAFSFVELLCEWTAYVKSNFSLVERWLVYLIHNLILLIMR
jgi:hypothetical protein